MPSRVSASAARSLPIAASLALHVAAPLCLGAGLYAARPALLGLAHGGSPAGALLARFGAFHLADGLWMYALTALLARVWREPCAARTAWLGAALVLGVAHELGQAVGALAGTFDPADLLVFAAAWALAIIVTPRPARRSN